jgi:hypothetical protein
MTKGTDRNIQIAAYHESGHIVLAYFFNYSCDNLQLDVSDPGMGQARINYGSDLMLVTSLINCRTDGSLFNSLDKSVKAQSSDTADVIAAILLAGAAAEAIYLNSGEVNSSMEIEVSGPDLTRVDDIDYFLSFIDPNHNANYINDKLKEVHLLMKSSEIWKAIDTLARRILAEENYKIDKVEIEQALTKCGFFDYMETLR